MSLCRICFNQYNVQIKPDDPRLNINPKKKKKTIDYPLKGTEPSPHHNLHTNTHKEIRLITDLIFPSLTVTN